MHTRASTIIAAGVIVSFVGIVSVLAYGRSVERRTQGGPTVSAFAAAKDIPAGTAGDDVVGSIREVRVPRDMRPSTAISAPEQVRGRTSVRPIAAGEVITTAQFGSSATAPASGLEIPPEHNAVTVNLPTPQGVAQYVAPGDLVNVYATMKGNGQDPRAPAATTKLVLANVQVLANSTAGSVKAPPANGEILLTVALKPSDAEKLVFAKENGSLWLGLVRPGDAAASTGGQTAATVLR